MKTLVIACVAALLFVSGSIVFAQGGMVAAVRADAPAPMTFEFKDTPFASAIDALFKGSGKSYVIDPEVDKRTMLPSLSLKDLSFDAALKAITKAGGATYRIDSGNIYVITARKPELGVPTPVSVPIADPEPVVTDRKVDKLALQYIDAADVAVMFGASGVNSRSFAMVAGAAGQTNGMGGMAGMGGAGMMGGMGGFGAYNGGNNMMMNHGMYGSGYNSQPYQQAPRPVQQSGGYQPMMPAAVAVGR